MSKIGTSIACLAVWACFSTVAKADEIHEASHKGRLEKVKFLLKKDPELVHARDGYGKTPLHWASMGVHQEVVEYLVEKGADVNAVDFNKVTALHSLAIRGHLKCIEFLIGKGADFRAKNIIDQQALIYAAAGGHVKVVDYLLAKGMDLSEADQDQGTPLHHAAHEGKPKMVEALVAKGAGVNTRNTSGLTPLDLALDAGHRAVARFLKSKGGRQTPIADAEVVGLMGGVYRITFPFSQRSNSCLLAGAEGVVLVDSGYKRTSRKLKSRAAKTARGDVRFLINTHNHPDHAGGNAQFGGKTVLIDLANLDKLVSKGVVAKSAGPLKGRSGERFDKFYVLNFGGQEIRIVPFPGVHTDSDLLVHFVKAGVVHMGDLLISQSFPSVGPKVSEYLDFLDRAIDVFPAGTTFISGHGADLDMTGLKAYRKMLGTTVAMVRQGLKAGKGVATMKKEKLLAEYDSYNAFIPFLCTDYWIDSVARSEAKTP